MQGSHDKLLVMKVVFVTKKLGRKRVSEVAAVDEDGSEFPGGKTLLFIPLHWRVERNRGESPP